MGSKVYFPCICINPNTESICTKYIIHFSSPTFTPHYELKYAWISVMVEATAIHMEIYFNIKAIT